MRHPQTPAEASLWRHMRDQRLGYKFRRQHPIGRFIIDFYCAQMKLCIEIDGPSHLEPAQAEYDTPRTAYLEGLGYRVIRFTNTDVRYHLQAILTKILQTIAALQSPSPFQGVGRGEGGSLPNP